MTIPIDEVLEELAGGFEGEQVLGREKWQEAAGKEVREKLHEHLPRHRYDRRSVFILEILTISLDLPP